MLSILVDPSCELDYVVRMECSLRMEHRNGYCGELYTYRISYSVRKYVPKKQSRYSEIRPMGMTSFNLNLESRSGS